MAASIFHGAPGSFKSASAMWFEILPALREGRLVVTNMEGVLPKEEIEIELNEVFPESAQIWRLSSQTDEGLFLWRRWFWWMPVGAFIVLDEVQDVFPNDSTVFKPVDLDSLGIDSIKDHLPEKFYNFFQLAIAKFIPPDDSGSKDDTGETILDKNGHIIYPKNMREANMRHRKYNWDIIYCTPEITEIHKLVRSVCQYAYKHKYFDSFEFIPYFNRRPRIHEHSPKSTGETNTKGHTTKWRKIPLQVHRCYRSTSTGDITKRRGANALKDPSLIFAIALLLCCFGYAAWYLLFKDDEKTGTDIIQESITKTSDILQKDNTENSSISSNPNDIQATLKNSFSLDLPYNAQDIYFNGYVQVELNKTTKYKEYAFTLLLNQKRFSLNTNDMQFFGIKIYFINECKVKLIQGNKTRYVYCEPRYSDETRAKPEQRGTSEYLGDT